MARNISKTNIRGYFDKVMSSVLLRDSRDHLPGVRSYDPANLLDVAFNPGERAPGHTPRDQYFAHPVAWYQSAGMLSHDTALPADFRTQMRSARASAEKIVDPSLPPFHARSVAEQLACELETRELTDLFRSFGENAIACLRSAGLAIVEHGGLHPEDSLAGFPTIRLKSGHEITLPPAFAQFACGEVSTLRAALEKFRAAIGLPELSESDANFHGQNFRDLSGQTAIVQFAVTLGYLDASAYEYLYNSTPPNASGLAPWFRVVSVEELMRYTTFQKKGWAFRHEVATVERNSAAADDLAHSHTVAPRNRLFDCLMGLGKLKYLTLRGPAVAAHLIAGGVELNNRGIDHPRELGFDPIRGLQCADGWFVPIISRVRDPLALDNHELWCGMRSLVASLSDSKFHQPPRTEEVHWNAEISPGPEWVHDQKGVFCEAWAWGLMHTHSDPTVSALPGKLETLSRPDSIPQYARASIDALLERSTHPLILTDSVSASALDAMTRSHHAIAFQALEASAPDVRTHPKGQSWDGLEGDKRLFKRFLTMMILDMLRHTTPAETALLSGIAARIEQFDAESAAHAQKLLEEPVLFEGMVNLSRARELFGNLAEGMLDCWTRAEEMSFTVAEQLNNRALKPPGKRERLADRSKDRTARAEGVRRNRKHVLGLAFWRGHLEDVYRRTIEDGWAHNGASPGFQLMAPFSRTLPWDHISNWVQIAAPLAEKIRNGDARGQDWTYRPPAGPSVEQLPPHRRLLTAVYEPLRLHWLMSQGRELLDAYASYGAMLALSGVVLPGKESLSAPEAYFIGPVVAGSREFPHAGDDVWSPLPAEMTERLAGQHQRLFERCIQFLQTLSTDLSDQRIAPKGYQYLRNSSGVESPRSAELGSHRFAVAESAIILGAVRSFYPKLWEAIRSASYSSGHCVGIQFGRRTHPALSLTKLAQQFARSASGKKP